MKAQLIAFGEIEIAGQRYHHDVVIDGGKIHQRAKKASKAYRETLTTYQFLMTGQIR
jgi:hypothetical protein